MDTPITHIINSFLEHTNLKPIVTEADIDTLVAEAKELKLLGVCVPPFWVKKVARELEGSDIKVVTVVGFPLGYQITEVKIEETKYALDQGASEIDLVMNISAFKTRLSWVKVEIAKIAQIVHQHHKILKLIIETAYLEEQEILGACKLAVNAGVDIVKTSTGFAPEGAKVEHIKLMRTNLPATVGIKASGGINTLHKVIEMINAGADRIGTSSSLSIMEEVRAISQKDL